MGPAIGQVLLHGLEDHVHHMKTHIYTHNTNNRAQTHTEHNTYGVQQDMPNTQNIYCTVSDNTTPHHTTPHPTTPHHINIVVTPSH